MPLMMRKDHAHLDKPLKYMASWMLEKVIMSISTIKSINLYIYICMRWTGDGKHVSVWVQEVNGDSKRELY